MPSNHTPNYQLSQWERTDKILMEDFNADNAKIDAALAALAFRLPVELARVKLTGTAKKITFDLSGIDLSKYRRLRIRAPQLLATTGSLGLYANEISTGYVRYSAGSVGGSSTANYVFIGSGTPSTFTTEISALGGGTAFYTECTAFSDPKKVSASWNWNQLSSVPYQELTVLEIICVSEEANLTAGSEAVLYGLRE